MDLELSFSLSLLPFGVSALLQFIFSLVIYFFLLADIFIYLIICYTLN